MAYIKSSNPLAKIQVDITKFGAVGDGVTDDTVALQTGLDYARDNGLTAVLPAGDYYVTGVKCYTPFIGVGDFISTNSASLTTPVFEFATHPDDEEILTQSDISSWGNFYEGQLYIPNATGTEDWYYFLRDDSQIAIPRHGGAGMPKIVHAAFGRAGKLSRGLEYNMNNTTGTWSIVRKKIRNPIIAQGVKIKILDAVADGKRVPIIKISRSLACISDGEIINESGQQILIGVEWDRCYKSGLRNFDVNKLGSDRTNYAYQTGQSLEPYLDSCTESGCRRGLDLQGTWGAYATNCTFQDSVGAHWGRGLTVENCTIPAQDSDNNPHVIQFSGSDLRLVGNKIGLIDGQEIVNMREDLPEISGYCIIEENEIIPDYTNHTEAAIKEHILIDFTHAATPAAPFDAGRALKMPRLISIRDNVIKLRGIAALSSTYKLQLLNVQGVAPSKLANATEFYGVVDIANNYIDYGDLTPYNLGGQPRTSITINKAWSTTGDGYKVVVSNMDSIYLYGGTNLGFVDTSPERESARHRYYVENVRDVHVGFAYGCYKSLIVKNQETYTFSNLTGGINFAGDGIKTTFDMGFPSTASATPLVVSVNGVVKTLGVDYTFSGNDLIFTVAPPVPTFPATINIEVDGTFTPVGDERIIAETVRKSAFFLPVDFISTISLAPATASSTQTSTNKNMYPSFDFDAATVEHMQLLWQIPIDWAGGNLSAKFHWSHPSTSTNFAVVWGIRGLSLHDGNTLDTAQGTPQLVTDVGGASFSMYTSNETPKFALSNDPSAGDFALLLIRREATNPADTLAVDAKLHGVTIFYDAIRDYAG